MTRAQLGLVAILAMLAGGLIGAAIERRQEARGAQALWENGYEVGHDDGFQGGVRAVACENVEGWAP